nr:hypothetical protein CFP56_25820 [Quercus suber]
MLVNVRSSVLHGEHADRQLTTCSYGGGGGGGVSTSQRLRSSNARTARQVQDHTRTAAAAVMTRTSHTRNKASSVGWCVQQDLKRLLQRDALKAGCQCEVKRVKAGSHISTTIRFRAAGSMERFRVE